MSKIVNDDSYFYDEVKYVQLSLSAIGSLLIQSSGDVCLNGEDAFGLGQLLIRLSKDLKRD